MEESKTQMKHREAHEQLVRESRAQFTRNRIVYVTPNGLHTAYDVDDAGIDGLITQLKEAKF